MNYISLYLEFGHVVTLPHIANEVINDNQIKQLIQTAE